jgi:L-histidine N-alpha-methyltransferase
VTPVVSTGLLGTAASSLAADVRHYLTQSPRQLPSRALYDTLGSALFDAICHLPWYPVTRAERRLIAAHRGEIYEAAGTPERLVELGCGNGEKLDLLLGPPDDDVSRGVRQIDLIDVSPSALKAASRLLAEERALVVTTHQKRYEEGLGDIAAERRSDRHGVEPLCIAFLGSNIGNFDLPGALGFLKTIHGALHLKDALLIGADMVKPARDLLLAYDDPLGVTAAFNKNLLVRLNRELGATFDISGFDHRAVWNAQESRVEMHLVSRRRQRVDIPQAALSIDVRQGEIIWTESSYKYEIDGFESMLRQTGFSPTCRWIDHAGRFLLVLATLQTS